MNGAAARGNRLRLVGRGFPEEQESGPCVLHVFCGGGGLASQHAQEVQQAVRYVKAGGYRAGVVCIQRGRAESRGVGGDGWVGGEKCSLYRLTARNRWDVQVPVQLHALCRQLRVGIWQGHDAMAGVLGLVLRRFWPMRVVRMFDGEAQEKKGIWGLLERWWLGEYDRLMCVGAASWAEGRKKGLTEERLVLLPEGVDLEWFRRCRTRSQARAVLGIGVDRRMILVVVRRERVADLERAVEVVGQLSMWGDELGRVELDVVGSGWGRRRLEELAWRAGVAGQVRVHEMPEDVRLYYEAADLVLVPWRSVRLERVILEAMAMGVAVACVDGPGVRSVLDEGACGLILSGQSWQWAGQIGVFLRDEESRAAMVRRAYRRVCERFDLAERVKRELVVYDQLLGRRVSRAVLRRAA